MTRTLLIHVPRPRACWVALLQDGTLQQMYFDEGSGGDASTVYKGRIVTIEPSIQAAFVNYGAERNGFLHITDVEPAYCRHLVPTPSGPGQPKPRIENIFQRGQEVIVQVIKDGVGGKGATLSTYISFATRYLVLIPSLNRIGVTRKIAGEEERARLRALVLELPRPRGLGFIVRTAGSGTSAEDLAADVAYLSRLWERCVRRSHEHQAPAELYREDDVIARALRDTFAADIDTVWVDEPGACTHAREWAEVVLPGSAGRIKLHEGQESLFHKYGIADESMHPGAPASDHPIVIGTSPARPSQP